MRVSFLLVLVPAVALADASTPRASTELAVGDRHVTVALEGDDKIHVRVAGGGELLLDPAGRAYVGRDQWKVGAELVAGVAPVPLVKVSSRPEACSDFWDIYVSVVDGVPLKALALYGVADPPAMQSSTVKFAPDGTAVVTTRTSEDEKIVRTTRTRYRFDGRVYVAVPKRAAARSK
ncbi:MAG TPA: hypothetical protein VF334_10705 [Polyangia bacterium]